MAAPKHKEKRYVLLDSNIISSFSNEELGEKLLEVLQEAVRLGYGIAVSDITFFEVINGTSTQTEEKMMQTLNGVERFYIKRDILFAAGHLGALYKDHGLPLDQFGVADQIIAATALLRNCIIFTKNGRDFPPPMFKELDRRMIQYTSKEYPVCVPTYFMEPQVQYIGEYYENKRLAPHRKKTDAAKGKGI